MRLCVRVFSIFSRPFVCVAIWPSLHSYLLREFLVTQVSCCTHLSVFPSQVLSLRNLRTLNLSGIKLPTAYRVSPGTRSRGNTVHRTESEILSSHTQVDELSEGIMLDPDVLELCESYGLERKLSGSSDMFERKTSFSRRSSVSSVCETEDTTLFPNLTSLVSLFVLSVCGICV